MMAATSHLAGARPILPRTDRGGGAPAL